ncbi:hypothetical protein VYU27_004515 [Nannochloropsis oceanica]
MPRSCATTGARLTRATTTLVISFILVILLCPCLILLTAAASASSTAPPLDATCTGSTASRTAGIPLAPVIAGWFQSSASSKHHKAEKKRQLLQQQLEQQQRQEGDGKSAESVTVAFVQSGKDRGLGVVRVFASTLRASFVPLVQGVITLFSVVARTVEWGLVKAPRAATGKIGKSIGQAWASILSLAQAEIRAEGGVRAYNLPKETGVFLTHTAKRIGHGVVGAAATAGQRVHYGAKHVHGHLKTRVAPPAARFGKAVDAVASGLSELARKSVISFLFLLSFTAMHDKGVSVQEVDESERREREGGDDLSI